MVVQYQFLKTDQEAEGMIATTTLPTQVSIPANAAGVRVLTIQNKGLASHPAMPGGWFNFPSPGCVWTSDSGHPPQISFNITAHSISCH
jgi:hypothetical protein